jgi:hypothetical protein
MKYALAFRVKQISASCKIITVKQPFTAIICSQGLILRPPKLFIGSVRLSTI